MVKETSKKSNYGADSIQVLEGLDPVRKRPGMYIGSTGPDGLHHLIWEVVDNSLDEAMGGHADYIQVTLLPDNYVSVSDNGRGIPVEKHKQTGLSALETVMTTLHAGGKFGGEGYKVSTGLHGVGVSVVNALSVHLKVEVTRDGFLYEQEYKRGERKSGVKKVGKAKGTGTTVTFQADLEIFKEIDYNWDRILTRLRQQAYLTKGITIKVSDQRTPLDIKSKFSKRSEPIIHPSHTFYFEGGLVSYITFLNRHEEPKHKNVFYVSKEQENIFVEAAFQYTDAIAGNELSFANNVHTPEGGSHLTGFRSAITRTFNDFARKNSFIKDKEENLTGEDIREGLTAVISVRLQEPQFEGQTKSKLGTTEARTVVENVLNVELIDWLDRHPQDGKEILAKIILAAKARVAAKAARDTVIRKGALEGFTLPGKLADCSSRKAEESEIFIVEGDSAGGCFSGDTKVALTDGRNVSFKELVKENRKGRQNYCYTIQNDGTVGIAPIKHPRITKKNVEVIKLILDNGEDVVCTPDHKFMLADGTYKQAKDVKLTDSLKPLYRQLSKIGKRITIKGYEMIYDSVRGYWIFTHLLSDQYNLTNKTYNKECESHIHHRDYNKLNNNPDNLVRLTPEQHLDIHRKHISKTLHRHEVFEKLRILKQTSEFRFKISQRMKDLEINVILSKQAKQQWQNPEYKEYMRNRFIEFYKSNRNYRELNNKNLYNEQKLYWSKAENKQIQSDRMIKYSIDNPEKKEKLSQKANDQWSDMQLRQWRSNEIKQQWTNVFRSKRMQSYNVTCCRRALETLRSIYDKERIVNVDTYQKIREKTNDKTLLKYSTICERFFDNNDKLLKKAVIHYNHKIVSIEQISEPMDVYDIEVHGTHNFALSSGVFVHNSAKQGRNRHFQAILPLRGKVLNVERARIDKMLAHSEIRALVIAMGTAIADEFDIEKLRYHKIVIMTDADVDGAHIRTLLLTLFYRYFPKLIEGGYLYIAQPPLYRIEKSKKVQYVYSDSEKNTMLEILKKEANAKPTKIKKNSKKDNKTDELVADAEPSDESKEETEEEKISGVSIQRYKGLGEMNADQLWETTMNPESRVLLQVTIQDVEKANDVFDILMGADVAPRKKFIQTRASNVKNLDI